MPSRPPGSWALLQIYFSGLFGARWQNDLFFKPDGSIPGTFDVQAAANAMSTWVGTHFLPLMHQTNECLGIRFYINNGVYTTSADAEEGDMGSLAGGAMPPDDSIIVRSQSNEAGRGAKGRLLIGGTDVSLSDTGRLNGAGVTAMGLFITAITTAVPAGGVSFTAAHFNRVLNTFTIPDFWSFNPVLGNRKKRSPIF